MAWAEQKDDTYAGRVVLGEIMLLVVAVAIASTVISHDGCLFWLVT